MLLFLKLPYLDTSSKFDLTKVSVEKLHESRRYNIGTRFARLPTISILWLQIVEYKCRNKALQTMFQMIGGAEKAGSGIDKILQGWKSQGWIGPGFRTQYDPDRVTFVLPFISFLPEGSKLRLREKFGARFDSLSVEECQAVVLAETEGVVSNARLQLTSRAHPADISKLLRNLVKRGFLVQDGEKRPQCYTLPTYSQTPLPFEESSPDTGANSPHNGASSPDNGANSPHNGSSSPDNDPRFDQSIKLSDGERLLLEQIAARARESRRLNQTAMSAIILNICHDRWLGVLKGDPKATVIAAAQAQRTADYIRGVTYL